MDRYRGNPRMPPGGWYYGNDRPGWNESEMFMHHGPSRYPPDMRRQGCNPGSSNTNYLKFEYMDDDDGTFSSDDPPHQVVDPYFSDKRGQKSNFGTSKPQGPRRFEPYPHSSGPSSRSSDRPSQDNGPVYTDFNDTPKPPKGCETSQPPRGCDAGERRMRSMRPYSDLSMENFLNDKRKMQKKSNEMANDDKPVDQPTKVKEEFKWSTKPYNNPFKWECKSRQGDQSNPNIKPQSVQQESQSSPNIEPQSIKQESPESSDSESCDDEMDYGNDIKTYIIPSNQTTQSIMDCVGPVGRRFVVMFTPEESLFTSLEYSAKLLGRKAKCESMMNVQKKTWVTRVSLDNIVLSDVMHRQKPLSIKGAIHGAMVLLNKYYYFIRREDTTLRGMCIDSEGNIVPRESRRGARTQPTNMFKVYKMIDNFILSGSYGDLKFSVKYPAPYRTLIKAYAREKGLRVGIIGDKKRDKKKVVWVTPHIRSPFDIVDGLIKNNRNIMTYFKLVPPGQLF